MLSVGFGAIYINMPAGKRRKYLSLYARCRVECTILVDYFVDLKVKHMSVSLAAVFMTAGVAIIVMLVIYAARLRREVKRRDAFRREEDARAITNSLENLDYVTKALVQGQVEITEGAWRCKVLLEIIEPSLAERKEFSAFAEVYHRTQHLKTHSARSRLTPRERMLEDKERLQVEEEMRQRVLQAAKAVIQWRADGGKTLH